MNISVGNLFTFDAVVVVVFCFLLLFVVVERVKVKRVPWVNWLRYWFRFERC